uniref:Uncharacterized protein n=1 Tax=Panagrolaimus sp. JU765 TaxID=591449 RepID=A0AC34QRI7_9BILA
MESIPDMDALLDSLEDESTLNASKMDESKPKIDQQLLLKNSNDLFIKSKPNVKHETFFRPKVKTVQTEMEAAEEIFQMSSLEADEFVEDNDDLKDVNGFEKYVNASAMKEITNLDEEHLDDSRAVLTSIDEYPQSSIIDVSEHSGDQVKITNAVELEPIILPANNTDDFIADSELQDLVQSIVHKVETILEHVNCEGLKSDEGEHGLESNDAVNVVEGSVTSQENVDPAETQESVVESDNSDRSVHDETGTDDGLNEAAYMLDSCICDESPKDEKIESNKVVDEKTVIETVAGASHSAHCSYQDLENKEVAELLDETIEAVIAGSE